MWCRPASLRARCFRMFSLLLLSLCTTTSDVSSRLVFPDLKSPHYNVSVALGATARLPCTVTNVEHQAVREGGREET